MYLTVVEDASKLEPKRTFRNKQYFNKKERIICPPR